MKRIHHLGLVIQDLDEALTTLGLDRSDVAEVLDDQQQKNRIYFIHMKENNLWLELLEPLGKEATTWNFARKHGMGLHHLAFGCSDLDAAQATSLERPASFVLGRYDIDVRSFGGRVRTLFIAVRGLIIEFVKNIR